MGPAIGATSAPRPPRRLEQPAVRVLLFSLALALVAGLLQLLVAPARPHATDLALLVALAAAFGLAEVFVVHLHLRREAHTLSFSELPLVVGLLYVAPGPLVAARLVGAAVALAVHRRQPLRKLLFNLSNFALEVEVARIAFDLVDPSQAGTTGIRWWGAAFAATCAANVVGAFTISGVIALHEGTWQVTSLAKALAAQTVLTVVNTSCAVAGVIVMAADRRGAALLVVVAGALYGAYRGVTSLSQRYARVETLYDFTRDLGRPLDEQTTVRRLLAQTRELLRADGAQLTVFDGDRVVRTTLDAGGHLTTWVEPGREVERAVAESGTPLLVPRHPSDPAHQALLAADGHRDLILAPLPSEGRLRGAMAAFDRSGDVETFDEDDLRLFAAVAIQAGVSLENGRLLDQLRAEVAAKEHQANHDALTGLPNRSRFAELVEAALRGAVEADGRCAVMLMDLDRFKDVNDTLGHHNGDLLLCEIARRLRQVLDDVGTVARLGGDEFAILLPASSADEARDAADAVVGVLEEPITLDELTLDVRGSIGIALFPDSGHDGHTLLQRADVAMYAAKANRTGVEVYSRDRDGSSTRTLALVGELRHAIESGALAVHYQPVVHLASGQTAGAEALLRWDHPKHGLVPPDEFIPLAEHTGLIRPLTQHVLSGAIAQCATWRRTDPSMRISVNLSARSLLDADLPLQLALLLDRCAVPASAVTLEITESSIMADPTRSMGVLGRLHAMGVRLAIDDFGTGYSSLSYLRRLPVSEVKIDKSFVVSMADNDNDAAIVRSTIELAHNLGLAVVAEGIEDGTALAELAQLGCDLGQGFLLGHPMSAQDFDRWVAARRLLATA